MATQKISLLVLVLNFVCFSLQATIPNTDSGPSPTPNQYQNQNPRVSAFPKKNLKIRKFDSNLGVGVKRVDIIESGTRNLAPEKSDKEKLPMPKLTIGPVEIIRLPASIAASNEYENDSLVSDTSNPNSSKDEDLIQGQESSIFGDIFNKPVGYSISNSGSSSVFKPQSPGSGSSFQYPRPGSVVIQPLLQHPGPGSVSSSQYQKPQVLNPQYPGSNNNPGSNKPIVHPIFPQNRPTVARPLPVEPQFPLLLAPGPTTCTPAKPTPQLPLPSSGQIFPTLESFQPVQPSIVPIIMITRPPASVGNSDLGTFAPFGEQTDAEISAGQQPPLQPGSFATVVPILGQNMNNRPGNDDSPRMGNFVPRQMPPNMPQRRIIGSNNKSTSRENFHQTKDIEADNDFQQQRSSGSGDPDRVRSGNLKSSSSSRENFKGENERNGENDSPLRKNTDSRNDDLKASPREKLKNLGEGEDEHISSIPKRRIVGSGSGSENRSLKLNSRDNFREDNENEEDLLRRKGMSDGSGKLKSVSRESGRDLKNLREVDPDIVQDFMFSNIKCFRTKQKEYFGAIVHMKSGFHMPYIRDRPQDPLSSNDCRLERAAETPNSYQMRISDLRSCGVEQCGNQEMCLTMVFPRVPTLAMSDDEVTTIKCTPQKSTMSETRTISFAGDSLENRRSGSTVEGGGQEFAAEVGVFRQNPGTKNGLFVKRVNSGGVVQLGEPLQLRSVVRGGDGWSFSKLTDVKVWRMRDSLTHNLEKLNPNDASEVITLVDPKGCRNTEYKMVSDFHPLRDPRNDLVHHFNFKAFLFRGQRTSEPLVITAKVQACQDREDCGLNDCSRASDSDLDGDSNRFKRSPTEIKNASSIIHDWSSQFALRVVGPNDNPETLSQEDFNTAEGRSLSSSYSCYDFIVMATIGGGLSTLFICCLTFSLVTFCRRSRFRRYPQLQQPESSIEIPSNNPNPNSILKRSLPFHPTFFRKSDNKNSESHKYNTSARNTNPNTNFIKANKPLPSLPLEKTNRNSEKLTKSDIENLLHQLSSQNRNGSSISSGSEPAEYACIRDEDENNNNNGKNRSRAKVITKDNDDHLSSKNGAKKSSDGVYIVYCCDKRSRSAPASLRAKKNRKSLKKFHNDNDNDDTTDVNLTEATVTEVSDSEIEDDDALSLSSENGGAGPGLQHGFGGGGSERRTVRSVKRSYRMNKNLGIRQKITSAVYKDGGGHGSFPKRVTSGKRNASTGPGGGSETRSCRERKHVNFTDIYSPDEFSTQISSEDSAYFGSVSSKMTTTSGGSSSGKTSGLRGNDLKKKLSSTQKNYENEARGRNLSNFLISSAPNLKKTQQPNSKIASVDAEIYRMENRATNRFSGANKSTATTTATHFVTRNDTSTQIIIIPETNV